MDLYAKQALEEYNSPTETVRRGGTAGKPFWNINASQFMFVPQFSFPDIPGAKRYVYTATDCEGKEHTFESDSPIAALDPIWADIPTGLVTLKVEGIHARDGII